jgi:hypothetical protein
MINPGLRAVIYANAILIVVMAVYIAGLSVRFGHEYEYVGVAVWPAMGLAAVALVQVLATRQKSHGERSISYRPTVIMLVVFFVLLLICNYLSSISK